MATYAQHSNERGARRSDARPSKESVEEMVDEALEETFPASDPLAVGGDRIPSNPCRTPGCGDGETG